MSEPERLLIGSATDFERTLLESVRTERPSSELTARMERALGLALPLGVPDASGVSGHADVVSRIPAPPPAGSASLAKSLASGAAKGLFAKAAVGTLVGTGLVASAVVMTSRAPTTQSGPAPIEVPSSAPAAVDEIPALAPSEAATVPTETLRDEIVLLDAARAASSRGDVGAAREALMRYRREFPRGALGREARVLWGRLGLGPWRNPAASSNDVSPAEDAPRR